ncbi:hypothetical protein KRR38_33285 [Novosphingobium sp. G106]|uniref:hypothetical protein n=1 Tax=Novosphingobium sp. G106 TaxID=2849500 RepID=UPI001C2DD11C|nr:hypothetical protein [Novosphingobium sp. G106]MBV1692385.1 hypothetical protein [Novosphingobium sp. G106]
MPDIDQALHRLGALPVPVELDEIDDAVFACLARRRREAAATPRVMGFAVALALIVGIAGGGLAGSEPASAQPMSPFAPDNPLAPSTLLDVHP